MDLNEDQDKFFSYNTKQLVNIQDRWLGLTNFTITGILVLYICLGVIWGDRGYLEFEDAKGAIATHVHGDAYATSSGLPGSRYFSAEDLTQPGLENGNVFVATRQKIYRQRRGDCEDHTMPCEFDSDCTDFQKGRCTSNGYCQEPSWCNVEDPEIYDLEVGNFYIWVKSAIQFIKIAPDIMYSTENNHPYPEVGYNSFTVRDLLMKCEPVAVRYEEVSELGAAIEVQFVWECAVPNQCKPTVQARRIDVMFDQDNIGYNFHYSEYISEDERMLHEVQGVRIFFKTVGQGRKVSVTALVLKASTAACLISLAPIVADLLMLKMFRLKRKYKARKYEVSQDFSDYINRRQQLKEEQAMLPKKIEEDEAAWLENEQTWQRRLDEDY